jgi:hypothetical protein
VVSGGRKANLAAIFDGHGGQQNKQQISLKLRPIPFIFRGVVPAKITHTHKGDEALRAIYARTTTPSSRRVGVINARSDSLNFDHNSSFSTADRIL